MIQRLLPKTEFAKHVITLMTGASVAQIIPLLLSPILTRLYGPTDFGVFAIYLSVVGLFSVIATGRYELAIVLPKKTNDALALVKLSFIITSAICLSVIFALILFNQTFLDLLKIDPIKYGNILYFLPISVFFLGLFQALNYWFNRKKRFAKITIARVSRTFFGNISQIGIHYTILSSGLIVGNIIGVVIASMIFIINFFRLEWQRFWQVSFNDMKKNALIYKDFPLINSFHVFSDLARTSLFALLISYLFDNATLGFYALSLRVLQAPLGVIASSFGQVLYQKFSSVKNQGGNIYDVAKPIISKLLLFSLPFFTFLFIFGSEIFSTIFGQEWAVAGQYSQIMIPYLFANFLVSPISQIPVILNKQKSFFLISLFGNITTPSLLILCSFLGYDIEQSLTIISAFLTCFFVFILFWLLHIAKEQK